MTDDTVDRLRQIEKRWAASLGQVAASVAAVDQADLRLANDDREITTRRARLSSRNLDLEAIVGEDDSLWLAFLSRGLSAARAVGRIIEPQRFPPHVPIGTGVLVSRRLLLTNNHVMADVDRAGQLAVEMGYQYGEDGTDEKSRIYRLDPSAGFFTDLDRDFTVVAVADLDGAAPGEVYGVVTLIPQQGKVLKAERLNVIHHPGGDRKRVSIRENRMVAEDDIWLRYTSDTRPGSSGAPVFNDQWEMVALHHGGIPRGDGLGDRLVRTGGPFDGAGEGTSGEYLANEGVRASRIVERLRTETDPTVVAMVQNILPTGANS